MSLRDELQQIYDQHQYLSKELVVEEARNNPDSALHGHVFHVDDDEAAERYYLQRAGRLIRTIKIRRSEYQPDPSEGSLSFRVRKYQSIPGPGQRPIFKSSEEVAQDPFVRELKIREMHRDWIQFKQRWEHFSEFINMVKQDIDEGAA